jgi:hypothetical protein
MVFEMYCINGVSFFSIIALSTVDIAPKERVSEKRERLISMINIIVFICLL